MFGCPRTDVDASNTSGEQSSMASTQMSIADQGVCRWCRLAYIRRHANTLTRRAFGAAARASRLRNALCGESTAQLAGWANSLPKWQSDQLAGADGGT